MAELQPVRPAYALLAAGPAAEGTQPAPGRRDDNSHSNGTGTVTYGARRTRKFRWRSGWADAGFGLRLATVNPSKRALPWQKYL
jgi:hypothetical protein